jgi:ornithine cyclodeaminase
VAFVTRAITGDELRRIVPMSDAIAAVREAYIGSVQGAFSQVPRIGSPTRTLFVMLSERTNPLDGRSFGQSVKVVSYREENPASSLPVIQGVVLWFDGATGEPRLILDGAAVTARRTGAASGVASDLLASGDAHALAIVGTGAAAPDQARAVCAVREIRTIIIAGRDFEKANALAHNLSSEFPQAVVNAVPTVREAVTDADIICTATTSRAPLFGLADVRSGVHINAIGSFSPQMCEVAPDIIAAARLICVDDLAALSDCGDLLGPIDAGQLERRGVALIGNLLLAGSSAPENGITLFKSIGIAAQDWAIAERVAATLNAEVA